MRLFAATPWQKYNGNPDMDAIRPEIGELCLWSVEILREREYFTGRLKSYNDHLYVRPENGFNFAVDDTLYYAHINEVISQGLENEQPQAQATQE